MQQEPPFVLRLPLFLLFALPALGTFLMARHGSAFLPKWPAYALSTGLWILSILSLTYPRAMISFVAPFLGFGMMYLGFSKAHSSDVVPFLLGIGVLGVCVAVFRRLERLEHIGILGAVLLSGLVVGALSFVAGLLEQSAYTLVLFGSVFLMYGVMDLHDRYVGHKLGPHPSDGSAQ